MDNRSNIRYEVLHGEEEQVPAQSVSLTMIVSPPPPVYEETESENLVFNHEVPYSMKLPSYDDATNLPTYEEAESEKSKQEEALKDQDVELQQDEDEHDRFTGMTIGTDGIFLCSFIMSFLFNWIGFLASLCISHTVAGRCGAISGLGLSIVKWVAIVKHNNWMSGFAEGDSWIWWLLIICGFMLFIRGAIQYARVKFEWYRFTGHLRRYYFF